MSTWGNCEYCKRRRTWIQGRGLCTKCYRDPMILMTARPARVQKIWTKLEEHRAVSMRMDGSSFRDIGAALGRTREQVNAKLVMLGIRSKQRRKGELRKAVRHWCGRGLFDWEVAIRLDITASVVARVRRQLGIPATDKAQSARARKRRKTA